MPGAGHEDEAMTFRLIQSTLLTGALLVPLVLADWPQWRGPEFNGTSPAASDLAVEWGPDKNVAWKTRLPSWSAATPAVWGDRIYVTSAQEGFDAPAARAPRGRRGFGAGARPVAQALGAAGRDEILLLALNRSDGSVLWTRRIGDGNRIYRKQNLSSPSPITDGERVWSMTGGGHFACHDANGEVLWARNIQKDYGRFGLNHGYASTPRLHDGRLYVQVLHGMKTDDPSYVFAVDAKTGKTVWKVNRPTDAAAESPDDYSTPLIVLIDGAEQLVVSGGDYVTGHDLATGKELWRMGGFNPGHERFYRTIASSVNISDVIYTTSTRGNPFIAFKPGGEGWIDDSAKLWENTLGSDVPTPTTDGERILVVNDRGILNVLDAQSGELMVDRLRLEPGTYSSSPLLADGKLYATNEEGATTVVDVEDGYQILAVNRLDSHTLASPIAVDRQIFLRTADHLYCIEKD